MTDDPCDSLPETNIKFLWGFTMLERTTDPIIRKAIKYSMCQQYGRLLRPVSIDDSPHDSWKL